MSDLHNQIINFVEYNGLTRQVTAYRKKNNILDLFWTNMSELYEAVVFSEPIANSDHNAVCATVIMNHDATNTTNGKFRIVKHFDFNTVARMLSQTDWNLVFAGLVSVDKFVAAFINIMTNI